MRDRVWSWLMAPGVPLQGFVAQAPDGALLGLVHVRAFHRPSTATIGGYMDDLFVSPAARGQKLAEALIAAVRDYGTAQGWSVIRWITAEDNGRARAVYDRVTRRTKWVTYDLSCDSRPMAVLQNTFIACNMFPSL